MSTEFWITYRFTSQFHVPPTTQLVELENPDYKLTDLEDVLDHVFRQGFIEARYRPVVWWEKRDGVPVKASTTIAFLLNEGIGKCPDNALQLVIEDAPTGLWFSYIYIHNPPAEAVTQRIKFSSLQKRFEKIAHVTNYVFAQGYLPAKYRPHVFWETPCGKRVSECASVDEVLVIGEGVSEEKPLRLVIDDKHHHHGPCGEREFPHWHHQHEGPFERHHHHEPFEHHHHHEFCGHRPHHEPFEHHHHEPCEYRHHHEPLEHHHWRHEFREHSRRCSSCPSSPTIASSPLKITSRFH